MSSIKIGIVGVGNCASSLIQGGSIITVIKVGKRPLD
jgi:myo-inositol-1-phosphate synthase